MWKKYLRFIFHSVICLIISILTACSGDKTTGVVDIGTPDNPNIPGSVSIPAQSILFEVSHINFAWGFQFYGFYIDSAGSVYSFRYQYIDNPWQPADPCSLTENELMEKYSHNPAFVMTLDPVVVRQMFALTAGAAHGKFSERQHMFCDYGSTSYTAYTFNAGRETYAPIMLLEYGDWTVENKSPEAHALVSWLQTIHVNYWE